MGKSGKKSWGIVCNCASGMFGPKLTSSLKNLSSAPVLPSLSELISILSVFNYLHVAFQLFNSPCWTLNFRASL